MSTFAADDQERELTLTVGDDMHHLMRTVPDPYGDRLVLSVIVAGSSWQVSRAWKQLRAVAVDALTAGPSDVLRPVDGQWSPGDAVLPHDPMPPRDAAVAAEFWSTRQTPVARHAPVDESYEAYPLRHEPYAPARSPQPLLDRSLPAPPASMPPRPSSS